MDFSARSKSDRTCRYLLRVGTILIVLSLLAGCVPRETLNKMQDQLNYLESSERRQRRTLDKLDSLLTESLSSNRELRADVYTALDEFRQELTAMRENLIDLGNKVDRRGTDHAVVYQPQVVQGDSAATNAGQPGMVISGDPITINCGQLFDQGFDDLRKGNYTMAIQGFEEFLRTCASSPDVPRALYWLGECYYANEDFAQAVRIFTQVIDEFGETEWVPGSLFKLGRCYEKTEQTDEAIANYERLVNEFPNAGVTRPAEVRLETLREEEE